MAWLPSQKQHYPFIHQKQFSELIIEMFSCIQSACSLTQESIFSTNFTIVHWITKHPRSQGESERGGWSWWSWLICQPAGTWDDLYFHCSRLLLTLTLCNSSAWAQSILPASRRVRDLLCHGLKVFWDFFYPFIVALIADFLHLIYFRHPCWIILSSRSLVYLIYYAHRHLQHSWDELLHEHHFSALLDSASDSKAKAHLLLVASSESASWCSLPVPSLGTKLDNESLRIALSLCLGVSIVVRY